MYIEGGAWYCPYIKTATQNILEMISARKRFTDIIFTKFIADESAEGVWKQYNIDNAEINEDAYANDLIDELKPVGEKFPVYSKSLYSSLSVPELKEAALKADRVLVSGVVAECCVLATVMSLIDARCKVIYLTDAVAGVDDATEQAVIQVLQGLSPLHVEFMTTAQYLESVQR